MERKRSRRIYVDLYAGAGFANIRDSARIIAGSPIRALLLPDAFDKYIFCEENKEKLEALKARVKRIAPASGVAYVEGDCNEHVGEILEVIPAGSRTDAVLSLCLPTHTTSV
jgi:three-Cys-motif partner protein